MQKNKYFILPTMLFLLLPISAGSIVLPSGYSPNTDVYQCDKNGDKNDLFASSVCRYSEKQCRELIHSMTFVQTNLPPVKMIITGQKRAYFHAFPSVVCQYHNRFVIPGDVMTTTSYQLAEKTVDEDDYILLTYNGVTGWIERDRVANEEEFCRITQESIHEQIYETEYSPEKSMNVSIPSVNFYSAPNKHCREKKRYLIKNDRVRVIFPEAINGFLHVGFTHSETGKYTLGWLPVKSLTPEILPARKGDIPVIPPDRMVLDFYDSHMRNNHFPYEKQLTDQLRENIRVAYLCFYDQPEPLTEEEIIFCQKVEETSSEQSGNNVDPGSDYFLKAQDVLTSWQENRKAFVAFSDNRQAVVNLTLGEDTEQESHRIVKLKNVEGQWRIEDVR